MSPNYCIKGLMLEFAGIQDILDAIKEHGVTVDNVSCIAEYIQERLDRAESVHKEYIDSL